MAEKPPKRRNYKAGPGRPKGSRNKATQAVRDAIADRDPIGKLFELADTTEDEKVRLMCLRAVLPYAYPKLSSVDVSMSGELKPVTIKVVPRGNASKG